MTRSSYRLSIEEINYLVVAALVTAAAFIAFSGELTLGNSAFYVAVSAAILGVRELGQRTIAQWMQAHVDLKLSVQGAALTVIGAIAAVITDLPFLLLFPVANSFSVKRHEHWGKEVDAMWMKRKAYIVYGGIIALLLGGIASSAFELGNVANAFWLFTVFQLLPFDNDSIPTGTLDGAYILKQNGAYWLIFMAFGLTGLVFL